MNFSEVIFKDFNETEVFFLRGPHIFIDCLKCHQVQAQLPENEQCRNIVMASVDLS